MSYTPCKVSISYLQFEIFMDKVHAMAVEILHQEIDDLQMEQLDWDAPLEVEEIPQSPPVWSPVPFQSSSPPHLTDLYDEETELETTQELTQSELEEIEAEDWIPNFNLFAHDENLDDL
ncbi:hypothetical protein [Pacific flying fox associated multicomponent virus]|nr:hypothetical protein [Pacific flying fox associated multicomponent virus]